MKEIATASLNIAWRADKITTTAYYCGVGFIIIANEEQMVWSSPRANAGKKHKYYSRAAAMPTKTGQQTKGLKQGGEWRVLQKARLCIPFPRSLNLKSSKK